LSTAQETYRDVIKREIAPPLRALGFKGSGQNYELPSATHWALLGFQKSAWSNKSTVRFTVNLTVVDRDDWARLAGEYRQIGERPSANSYPAAPIFPAVYESSYWHSRLGELTPERRDLWWDIAAGEAPGRVAREVVGAITNYALPAMRSHMDD
jgi:hypothetical protein